MIDWSKKKTSDEVLKELLDKELEDTENAIDVAVNNIVITYGGNTFSGSYVSQSKMVTAMVRLEGKGDTKTQNFFTSDKKTIKLTRDDFDNILDLIEPIMESVTNQ